MFIVEVKQQHNNNNHLCKILFVQPEMKDSEKSFQAFTVNTA